tara:strand:+ start:474 stop:800 length:327 start_codon:yes stop_codon:yes gene_type:complete
MQNRLIPYSLIFIIIIPLFGFKFLIGLFGNLLLLILLIPVLLIGLGLLSFSSLKSNIQVCDNCGSTFIGNNINCPYCGSQPITDNQLDKDNLSDASNKIIEIEAEEIN